MTYNSINKAKDIWSSIGKVNAPATARVSGQEIIVNPGDNLNEGSAFIVPKGKEGADDQIANVKDEDGILGGKMDPRTGLPFYANPIDRVAAKGVHTIDNMMYKLLKNYAYRAPGQLGLNTLRLTLQQTASMKELFMKRLNTSLDLLKQIPSEEEMKQGLMAARMGKNSLCLPGFEPGKNKWQKITTPVPAVKINTDDILRAIEHDRALNDFYNQDLENGRSIYMSNDGKRYITDNTTIPILASANPFSNDPIALYIWDKSSTFTTRSRANNNGNGGNDSVSVNRGDEGPYKLNPLGGAMAELQNWVNGFGQLWQGRRLRIASPDFSAPNPTANMALNGLNQLRYNDYELAPDMARAGRLAAYANNNSGNSGGVIHVSNVASRLALAKQMADRRLKAQEYNNQLRGLYYNAALQYGNQQQQYASNIAQANYAARAASHNAAILQQLMGLRNMSAAAQQAYKNYTQAMMYNGMRGLYWKDLDDKSKLAIMNYEVAMANARAKGGNV